MRFDNVRALFTKSGWLIVRWIVVACMFLAPTIGGQSAIAAPLILDWGALGGANDHMGASVWFSPVQVSSLDTIESDGIWVNRVNTGNSNFFLFASVEIDGVWKIIAKTDVIAAPYGTEHALAFHINVPVSGSLTGIHLDGSLPGAGEYLGLNTLGSGTRFGFNDSAGVPESTSMHLLVAAICGGVVGTRFSRRKSRLQRANIDG